MLSLHTTMTTRPHHPAISSFTFHTPILQKHIQYSSQSNKKFTSLENIMASRIPMSNFVIESAVIEAPFSDVWHLIKLQDFAKFYSALEKSEWVKGTSPDTDIVRWTFKDGTVLEVKQEEHSTIEHYITYSIISSQPALTYTSAVSTVRLYAVTSGEHAGQTFVTWTGNFSSDADADAIEDAKFKRREALADLAKAVAKK